MLDGTRNTHCYVEFLKKKTFREISLKKIVVEENVRKYSVNDEEKWKLFS